MNAMLFPPRTSLYEENGTMCQEFKGQPFDKSTFSQANHKLFLLFNHTERVLFLETENIDQPYKPHLTQRKLPVGSDKSKFGHLGYAAALACLQKIIAGYMFELFHRILISKIIIQNSLAQFYI